MRINKEIPVVLTIAGSDSGGGAGIEADLKTFAALGVHGTVAITSVTAQNTYEVRATYDLPPHIVVKQIEAVADDMGIDAAKTGMLSNSEIIKAISEVVKNYGFPLVVDPVMIAKSGAPLLKQEAIETLIKNLIPIATVVTPNKMEAEKITSIKINSISDAKKAAKYIVEELGAKAAVVKGGHIAGDKSTDVLYYDGKYIEMSSPRIYNACTHGTGCGFSAAIAAELAKGKSIDQAVKSAKEFITSAIKYSYKIGKGFCPINPLAWVNIPAERYKVLNTLKNAVEILEKNGEKIVKYVPEVQINLVMALPKIYSKDINDVAGILGRIVRYGKTIKASGPPAFGASKHLAKAVLKIMEYHPTVRASMNLRYDNELIKVAKKLGFKVSYYDRREEPNEVKKVEGATIPWGIEQALKKINYEVPDIIYHLGDWGKEPIINVFGRDALDVVKKVLKLINKLQ